MFQLHRHHFFYTIFLSVTLNSWNDYLKGKHEGLKEGQKLLTIVEKDITYQEAVSEAFDWKATFNERLGMNLKHPTSSQDFLKALQSSPKAEHQCILDIFSALARWYLFGGESVCRLNRKEVFAIYKFLEYFDEIENLLRVRRCSSKPAKPIPPIISALACFNQPNIHELIESGENPDADFFPGYSVRKFAAVFHREHLLPKPMGSAGVIPA